MSRYQLEFITSLLFFHLLWSTVPLKKVPRPGNKERPTLEVPKGRRSQHLVLPIGAQGG